MHHAEGGLVPQIVYTYDVGVGVDVDVDVDGVCWLVEVGRGEALIQSIWREQTKLRTAVLVCTWYLVQSTDKRSRRDNNAWRIYQNQLLSLLASLDVPLCCGQRLTNSPLPSNLLLMIYDDM